LLKRTAFYALAFFFSDVFLLFRTALSIAQRVTGQKGIIAREVRGHSEKKNKKKVVNFINLITKI
jgi:hypothetical protein